MWLSGQRTCDAPMTTSCLCVVRYKENMATSPVYLCPQWTGPSGSQNHKDYSTSVMFSHGIPTRAITLGSCICGNG
jgi:hypothetical protein